MPDFSHEINCGGCVAGVDEAGRGPWAGPVVAGAVIFEGFTAPKGIHDSKKLTIAKREELYEIILEVGVVSIGYASVEEIDELNILGATKLAMQRAVAALKIIPDVVLVDGNQPPKFNQKTIPLVKGDSISTSIAAASIIAKVTRDKMMRELHELFPHYGWHRNAGYGTDLHIKGLAQFGVTQHHRKSFAPIRKLLDGQAA
jgi:ribonuclease HII